MSLFCRHNRFLADCPICSKGTVLDTHERPTRRVRSGQGAAARREPPSRPRYSGPYAVAGPYEDGAYEVRLERVPGGLRLAEWEGAEIRRRAPVLAAADLPGLLAAARERGVDGAQELQTAVSADAAGGPGGGGGVSSGRAGELREELRVERLEGGRLRVGRWLLRPNSGWQLQDAPVMMPPGRYAEALAGAARLGLLVS